MLLVYRNGRFEVILDSHFETNRRQLSPPDRLGLKRSGSDLSPGVRMVSPRHSHQSIEAWTKSAVDQKPGGGTERVTDTGFERVRTIARGRVLRDLCRIRHLCGQVDPSRRAKAGIRKGSGRVATDFQERGSPKNFASRGANARAGTNLVEQIDYIPNEPAGAGAFSD